MTQPWIWPPSNISAQEVQVAYAKAITLVPGVAGAVGRLTVDAILETPTSFAYAANVALDVGVKNDYVCSGTLTGNITFTFTNAANGRQGLLAVKQDGTGGRTVTFTAPAGWTAFRDSNTANLAAASGANAITLYSYAFLSVGGTQMLFIGKLTPVTP